MEELVIYERPVLRRPPLVFAFAGWPDACEAATSAVRYLIGKLGAKRFAEMDPEGFYDFTVVRPLILSTGPGQRELRWPSLEFFYWKGASAPRDLILFLAIEPSFRWRAFTNAVLSLAERGGASIIVGLGALLDNVPHTREPKVSGWANSPELRARLTRLGVAISDYQGPAGIHSALLDGCQRRGLEYATIWGHVPYYIRGVANPKVTLVLLRKLSSFLDLPLELEDLQQQALAFERRLEEALARNPDFSALVRRLEEQEEPAPGPSVPPGPLPGADVVVRELEEFLRRRRAQEGDGSPPEGQEP